jgi:quinol monooxygenase YgiN
MIHVIALITTQPGKRQELLDRIHASLPQVLAQPGCIDYTVVVDADAVGAMHTQTKFGPDTIVTIEKWESLKHLEDHSSSPLTATYYKESGPFPSIEPVIVPGRRTSWCAFE